MDRKIAFIKDCMRDCHIIDKETLKEKVIDVINKNNDYISQLEDGDTGKIADRQHQIFVKFFVTENKLLIDQVQEQVYVSTL
ncbi:hypothetical protein [Thermosediminibacter litoriperuensis]|uniref:Uncharacterized protein n=1 Tax=Thermosediminibacter litoriperuensis TaxID=291989 RepID=A0A5S5AZH9_9FIRM|nr:hypothetical protein [Thermosediminibacter litoriperuensis]TYP58861.1 hypothetical protein LZ11_00318 [Thermosediminibacter litoriperuensis]